MLEGIVVSQCALNVGSDRKFISIRADSDAWSCGYGKSWENRWNMRGDRMAP